jgi:hypothetical protein
MGALYLAATRLALLVPACVLLTALVVLHRTVPPGLPAGVPVEAIEGGRIAPSIGLVLPLPKGFPLPGKGHVIGAGVYPPQPPFGASASMMMRLDEPPVNFISSCRARLTQAGFALRHPTFAGPSDPALEKTSEADEILGGRTIYIAIAAAMRRISRS